MTRKFCIFAILLLASASASAQSVDTAWVRRYTGPAIVEGGALTLDASGYLYVAGNSYVSDIITTDYLIIKYSKDGIAKWVGSYDGPAGSNDVTEDIAVDGSGNVYVTGWSFGVGTDSDIATIKYDSSGSEVWVRRHNGSGDGEDFATAIGLDASGNAYVTGQSLDEETDKDYVVIRYYPDGDTAWLRTYDGPGNQLDCAHALAIDDFGFAYVTGESYASETATDCATIKYYPDGDTAWVARYNGPGNGADAGRAVAVDASGNVYVTGTSYSTDSDDDYVTIKYYPDGDTAWVRRYNGPGDGPDVPKAIAVDHKGRVYVTGASHMKGG
jgi:hypothetical protein